MQKYADCNLQEWRNLIRHNDEEEAKVAAIRVEVDRAQRSLAATELECAQIKKRSEKVFARIMSEANDASKSPEARAQIQRVARLLMIAQNLRLKSEQLRNEQRKTDARQTRQSS